MKRLLNSGSLIFLMVFTTILPVQFAHSDSVTGLTRLNFRVAEACVLDYYRNVNMNISTRTLHNLVAGNNSGRVNHGSVFANLDFRTSNNLNINPGTNTPLNNLPVRLQNAFAARCISRSGFMRVSAGFVRSVGRLGPRSWITANGLRIRESSGGPAAPSLVVRATGLNPNDAFVGAMGFNVDIRNVSRAGAHLGMVAALRVNSI